MVSKMIFPNPRKNFYRKCMEVYENYLLRKLYEGRQWLILEPYLLFGIVFWHAKEFLRKLSASLARVFFKVVCQPCSKPRFFKGSQTN